MPLVPHPPSVARVENGEDMQGPGRLPSGGGRPRDVSSFALAQKTGLPTLNFVKLKQETQSDLNQALAMGGGAAAGAGTGTGGGISERRQNTASNQVPARQFTAGAGGAGAGGQGARQYSSGGLAGQGSFSAKGARPPQAPNAGGAPVRRVVAGGGEE